jgi:DNA-binding CsgD family transcriptional regulator
MNINDGRAKELWDSLGPAERVISQSAMEEHRRKQEVECAACGHKRRHHDRDSDGWCKLTNDGEHYTGSGYPSRIAEKKAGNECWCQGFTTDAKLGLDLLLGDAHWKGLEAALKRALGRGDDDATSKILRRYIALTHEKVRDKDLIREARSIPRTAQSPLADASADLKMPPKLPQKKTDLSRYLDGSKLTDKQRECVSLQLEYGMPVAAIARRLGITRKTVDEHIAAANKKFNGMQASEKRSKEKAKTDVL